MSKITKSTEDYLVAIYQLGGNTHSVKSVSVAKSLGVSKPAVTLATANLTEQNLIEKVSYGDIQLTEKGEKIARSVYDKHTFIKSFLLYIGVSEKTADEECCHMEHVLHDETIECIKNFCATVDQDNKKAK